MDSSLKLELINTLCAITPSPLCVLPSLLYPSPLVTCQRVPTPIQVPSQSALPLLLSHCSTNPLVLLLSTVLELSLEDPAQDLNITQALQPCVLAHWTSRSH